MTKNNKAFLKMHHNRKKETVGEMRQVATVKVAQKDEQG
jgi:hypothetical protein